MRLVEVDLKSEPSKLSDVAGDYIAIGDLHGNTMKLIYALAENELSRASSEETHE